VYLAQVVASVVTRNLSRRRNPGTISRCGAVFSHFGLAVIDRVPYSSRSAHVRLSPETVDMGTLTFASNVEIIITCTTAVVFQGVLIRWLAKPTD
jgi:hypothetical protein